MTLRFRGGSGPRLPARSHLVTAPANRGRSRPTSTGVPGARILERISRASRMTSSESAPRNPPRLNPRRPLTPRGRRQPNARKRPPGLPASMPTRTATEPKEPSIRVSDARSLSGRHGGMRLQPRSTQRASTRAVAHASPVGTQSLPAPAAGDPDRTGAHAGGRSALTTPLVVPRLSRRA